MLWHLIAACMATDIQSEPFPTDWYSLIYFPVIFPLMPQTLPNFLLFYHMLVIDGQTFLKGRAIGFGFWIWVFNVVLICPIMILVVQNWFSM